ncbi:uncharacterized protein EI97DRAFT_463985 [Westerdykella ornata]|uniref:EKC/KEOPS complex subunit BUD32 n=1 Tax=Westerdykella ornata TaxID=318751 RepID=A0A6A6JV02_WESOR|nr:uncharacterized protein EI97DRAFT_463985 [Westerdykella ornata]KAF2279923.1 hypothetical protein EI97DRAFT_463985 [Westerdykella ornata]
MAQPATGDPLAAWRQYVRDTQGRVKPFSKEEEVISARILAYTLLRLPGRRPSANTLFRLTRIGYSWLVDRFGDDIDKICAEIECWGGRRCSAPENDNNISSAATLEGQATSSVCSSLAPESDASIPANWWDADYYEIPSFCHKVFGTDLRAIATEVFDRCKSGNLLFGSKGWKNWPLQPAKERHVIQCLDEIMNHLRRLAVEVCPELDDQPRRKLFKPPTDVESRPYPTVGFCDYAVGKKYGDLLVVGEVRTDPKRPYEAVADKMARCAEELFFIQPSRRYLLGFSLCGSLLQVWMHDRAGCRSSDVFDINTYDGGEMFVWIFLQFLFMDTPRLGFDSTVGISTLLCWEVGHIEITRDGKLEQIIVEKVLQRSHRICGRCTTCYKGRLAHDPKTIVVVKDSWHRPQHSVEGELLRKASENGRVKNIVRYYHHETVVVAHELMDDIDPPQIASRAPPTLLLKALGDCIEGYWTLWEHAQIVHRDISLGNLLVREEPTEDCCWGFLTDLDMATDRDRTESCQGRQMIGTHIFMSTELLCGDGEGNHSFRHDLESFFWVLFWLCVHYEGSEEVVTSGGIYKWCQALPPETLGFWKRMIPEDDDTRLLGRITPYYKPLVPCIIALRCAVFPDGKLPRDDEGSWDMKARMIKVLQDARFELEAEENVAKLAE